MSSPSNASRAPSTRSAPARMVILVDDEDRENEGDLVFAAELVTPEHINFMATHARGLICLAMDDAMIDQLELPMMVRDNQASLGTAFTVSIEARHGVSTGISARDRATTIRAAIADDAEPARASSRPATCSRCARARAACSCAPARPRARSISRASPGCKPAGVICEIMREDGEMARRPELEEFAAKHGLMLLSVADMIAYRLAARADRAPPGDRRAAPGLARRPASRSPRTTTTPRSRTPSTSRSSAATSRACRPRAATVLVRVAAMDPLADPFALRPDLDAALKRDRRGRRAASSSTSCNRNRMRLGASFERLRAAARRPPRRDRQRRSSEALRDFGLGAQVLADLGCKKIRLMMWSDRKIAGLEGFGIEVVERVPIPAAVRRAAKSAQPLSDL